MTTPSGQRSRAPPRHARKSLSAQVSAEVRTWLSFQRIKLFPEELIDDGGAGLSTRCLHRLTNKETQQGLLPLQIFLYLHRVVCKDRCDDGCDGLPVRHLAKTSPLDNRPRLLIRC